MDNKTIIGVDLAGTKIMTGAIDSKGRVLGFPVKVPTGSNDTADAIVKRITGSVDKILGKLNQTINDVAGIGIGSTGPLDITEGTILECPQLPNMHFFPLRKTIREFFGVPVFLSITMPTA